MNNSDNEDDYVTVPDGFMYLPPARDPPAFFVVGNVRKTIDKDWFAFLPCDYSRPGMERVLLEIINDRQKNITI